MISRLKSAGIVTILGAVAAGAVGLVGPPVANAQSGPMARTKNCGLSSGLAHWAYTNCGNSPALVKFTHTPLHAPAFSETRCIAKGAVETIGAVGLEAVAATELQGPCVPRK